MNDRHRRRFDPIDGGDDGLLIEHRSPRRLDFFHHRAAALGDIHHARAEHTIDADENLLSRLDQIDEERLHPRRAGAAHRQRHLIFRAKDLAQLLADLIHDLKEHRIEVADGGFR